MTKIKKTLTDYNLVATEIKSLINFPADAILISYSDHYRGNSGDDIFLTDNEGDLMGNYKHVYFSHWNEYPDDRGVQFIVAITHAEGKGAFATYMEFKKLCEGYVKASNDLKKWHSNETVWNINVPEYANNGCGDTKNFVGSKSTGKFEQSLWYRRVAKRCKPETIERKKKEYLENQEKYNTTVLAVLEENKAEMKSVFSELGISVRNAYLFLQGYIK